MTTESDLNFIQWGGLPFFPAAANQLGEGTELRITEPALDSSFIVSAAVSGSADALQQVEQHHRNVWTAANGAGLGILTSHRRRFLDRVKFLRGQFSILLENFRKVPPIVQQPARSKWDLTKFIFAIAGMTTLVAASVSTVFTLLRNTAVFEPMPVAAFVTAGLVAAIPVAGKLGIDSIRSETWLNGFRSALGWGAVACFCLWAVLLSRLTGGLGGGMQDPLAMTLPGSLSGEESSGWGLSTHLQYLQLIVELLGSLACFSYADLLYQRNRPGHLAINGIFISEFRRVFHAERAADGDARQLGAGKGRLKAFLAHREVFVGRARAKYLNVLQARARRDSLRAEYTRVQSALDSIETELSGERGSRFERSGGI